MIFMIYPRSKITIIAASQSYFMSHVMNMATMDNRFVQQIPPMELQGTFHNQIQRQATSAGESDETGQSIP
jgi:hypothetical protein